MTEGTSEIKGQVNRKDRPSLLQLLITNGYHSFTRVRAPVESGCIVWYVSFFSDEASFKSDKPDAQIAYADENFEEILTMLNGGDSSWTWQVGGLWGQGAPESTISISPCSDPSRILAAWPVRLPSYVGHYEVKLDQALRALITK